VRKMSFYLDGVDVLGSERNDSSADDFDLAQATDPEPALVIRVENPGELVQKQGGATGALVFDIAPSSVTGMIYSKMRDEMLKKFKEQGVNADVQITTSPPKGPPPKAEFVRGMVAGGATAGVVYLLYRLIRLAF